MKNQIGMAATKKTTDAEEILFLLSALRERAEILSLDTASKLSCVITDYPRAEKTLEPRPQMSPIFSDMINIIKDIDSYLDETQRSVFDAELPSNWGQAIACSEDK